MQPWLSCAFNQSCMCVKDFLWNFGCSASPPRRYGRCHRFDQSSLGIILSKLLLDQRPIVYLPPGFVRVAREERLNWFEPRKGIVVISLVMLCLGVNAVLCMVLTLPRCGRTSYRVDVRSYGVGVMVLIGEVVVIVYVLVFL